LWGEFWEGRGKGGGGLQANNITEHKGVNAGDLRATGQDIRKKNGERGEPAVNANEAQRGI